MIEEYARNWTFRILEEYENLVNQHGWNLHLREDRSALREAFFRNDPRATLPLMRDAIEILTGAPMDSRHVQKPYRVKRALVDAIILEIRADQDDPDVAALPPYEGLVALAWDAYNNGQISDTERGRMVSWLNDAYCALNSVQKTASEEAC